MAPMPTGEGVSMSCAGFIQDFLIGVGMMCGEPGPLSCLGLPPPPPPLTLLVSQTPRHPKGTPHSMNMVQVHATQRELTTSNC